jgi:hypothetical protein
MSAKTLGEEMRLGNNTRPDSVVWVGLLVRHLPSFILSTTNSSSIQPHERES